MKTAANHRARGFAIVLTVSLLALLVLIALAISMVGRLDSDLSSVARGQMVARENALSGLRLALGSVQGAAGPADRLTGMAGLVGIAPSTNSPTRYWTGVWHTDGSLIRWLVSGTTGPANPGTNGVRLVGEGSVGLESQTTVTTSSSREKEHVRVPLVAVTTTQGTLGHYAYWVGDEGIKLSAYIPSAERPTTAELPRVSPNLNATQLGTWNAAQAMSEGELSRQVAYEQFDLGNAQPSEVKESFHYLTLQARSPTGAGYVSGRLNLNTASRPFWFCVVATYNARSARLSGPTIAQPANVGRQIADAMVNGPFATMDDFQNSALLESALPGNVTPERFVQTLRELLTTRSDTFRIRAYGDALNPADAANVGATPEAVAYCEAIVQRTNQVDPLGHGQKFVIVYFRWLGLDDL